MAELYLESSALLVEAAGVAMDATNVNATLACEVESSRASSAIYKNWHTESWRRSRWCGSEAPGAISARSQPMRDDEVDSSFARCSRHWSPTIGSR
jgi:hypothetical protein